VAGNQISLLVVDDAPQIQRLLRTGLAAQRFHTVEAPSAAAALTQLGRQEFDLMILDLGLPDRSGLELIEEIRRGSSLPIIVLSVLDDETSTVKAFELGADDYVTKPFSMAELVARIRAALRHRFQAQGTPPVLYHGDLAIDLVNRRVTRAGADVKLSPTEYDILTLLAEHAGKILTHDYLLRRVWGPDKINDIQYLRVYVRALRRKLGEPDARREMIRTESGVGYRFVPVTTRPGESCQSAA
jgi:two-component system, OmpR family, KDP operon response regulator KdpE